MRHSGLRGMGGRGRQQSSDDEDGDFAEEYMPERPAPTSSHINVNDDIYRDGRGIKSTRGWVFKSACCWATGGGVIGGAISVIVNNALIEISLTPFFAVLFGVVLLLLGSLMIGRKLWERPETGCTRVLVLSFSGLVLVAGVVLPPREGLVQAHPPRTRCRSTSRWASRFASPSPLRASTCSTRITTATRTICRRALVQTPQQVGVVAGRGGEWRGLWLYVRHDGRRGHAAAPTTGRLSAPIGVVLGACVGAINAVLAYRAEASVGESIDLLRAEGLLDD